MTIDTTPPTAVLSLHPDQVDPASLTPVLFRLTFSEPVTGFASSNILLPSAELLVSAGTTDPAGLVYDIAVDFGGTGGAVSLSIDPAGITDEAGNALPPATVIDDSVDFDASFPYVSIEQAPSQPDPASGTPVSFRVVFSEPVSGFTAADVSLGGTAQPTTCVIAQVDAANYLVSVSGMAGDGTVIASIPSGIAVDALGNGNAPSFLQPTDNEVTLDTTPPTVSVTLPAGSNGLASGDFVIFNVIFSEPVTGFDASDDVLIDTVPPLDIPPLIPLITAVSSTTYTVRIDTPEDGDYLLTVPADAATDLVGHSSLASADIASQTRDTTPPMVSTLGTGEPFSLDAGTDYVLEFNEPLDAASRIAVGDAIAQAVAPGSLISSWSADGMTFTFQVTSTTDIFGPIEADVTDLAGNTATVVLIHGGMA